MKTTPRRALLPLILCLFPAALYPTTSPASTPQWFDGRAQWVWSSEGTWAFPATEAPYPTRFFRKTFEAESGDRLTVAVSADTRYKLWCNGTLVALGPAKGDISHHFFDEVVLDSLLRDGTNCLAAQVEYHGAVWPHYQFGGGNVSLMTACPGWILDGTLRHPDGQEKFRIHTDRSWKVLVDHALDRQILPGCTPCVGLYEDFDCAAFPWDFQEPKYDDSTWAPATEITAGVPTWADRDSPMPHRLTPRLIAQLEISDDRRFQAAFRPEGNPSADQWMDLMADDQPLTLPAHQRATVRIDTGELTTGYPQLAFSGGAGASIRIAYAEALKNEQGQKSNRNDLEFGEVVGCVDLIRPDGGTRNYSPFFWRTFRFLELQIETAGEPLELQQLTYRFTAYPFQDIAQVETSDPLFNEIWQVCWRTARLCAHETYEDCPYYEQLQYAGDTQIQAMISYLVAGDASLARQFLMQFDWSRQPNGLTRSRYPSQIPQTIPYWSLHWILSVRDYWMYTGDRETVADLFPGVRATLDYFMRKIGPEGTVGRLDGWLVADWCPEWPGGAPTGANEGVAAYDSLMTATALLAGAELALAVHQDPAPFLQAAEELKSAVHQRYFVADGGYYADRPGTQKGSAFTNVWAILAEMPCNPAALAERIFNDPQLSPLTMFSQSFAWDALAKAERFDLFPQTLDFWVQTLQWGLSTCPEVPNFEHARSDCHAWSAGPLIAWTREILGVRPLAPGWEVIGIEPKPSGLTSAKGSIPITRTHPDQPLETIEVQWTITDGVIRLQAEIPGRRHCKIRLPGGDWQEFEGPSIEVSAEVAG